MTTHDIDLVTQWLAAQDNDKAGVKVYHGERLVCRLLCGVLAGEAR